MGILGILQSVILNRAPKFLRGPNIGRFLEAAAFVEDTRLQTLAEGFKLSNPLLCDVSAFPSLSKDRGIPLYTTEPEASKRYRLAHWRQLRRHAGSAYGEMINVQPRFLPGTLPWLRVVHQAGDGSVAVWRTLDPLGNYTEVTANTSNWNWDGQTAKWSRWWAIVYLPVGYASGFNWDGGPAWDSGPVWDGIALPVLTDIYAMMYDWKAAHSWLGGLIVTALQPTDSIPGHPGRHPFDPTDTAFTDANGWTSLPIGNWGSPVWLTGPNVGLPSRPPWALYFNIANG